MGASFQSMENDKEQFDNINQLNLLKSEEYLSANGRINIPFGRDDVGNIIVRDLDSIPHILVCGISGSGKTSFVQTLLSVVCKNISSDDVKMVIYDSKRVEYLPFRNSQHLYSPMLFDRNDVLSEISKLLEETHNRLDLFAERGCRDINRYNELLGFSKLPKILFVIDDFSSLNLSKEEFNNFLILLNNARVSGIHFIVISSLNGNRNHLKEMISAFPCKIVFRLSSKADSKNVIEDDGAENLMIPGEMIFRYQGINAKCQCAHADYENINSVMNAVNKRPATILEFRNIANKIFDLPNENKEKKQEIQKTDYLLPEAGLFVIRSQKAYIGYLQRTLDVGFRRAARIMDELYEYGVVGPENGTKPRDILMSEDEWYVLSKRLQDGNSIPEGKKASFDTRTCDNPTNSLQKDKKDEPVIKLRNIPVFYVGGESVSVRGNEINYKKPIMTKFGPGHLNVRTNGINIKGIIYKKATVFSKGYFTFDLKDTANIKNMAPSMLYVNEANISEVIKMEFDLSENLSVYNFLKQISEDTGIPITYKSLY